MFSKGIPPTACPSAAYPRQGSKSLDRGGEFHASPPWVERHAHDQIEVVGSQWVWERSCRHSDRARVQHWVVQMLGSKKP